MFLGEARWPSARPRHLPGFIWEPRTRQSSTRWEAAGQRLTDKVYSELTQNNVHYEYGTTGRNCGRVTNVTDGSDSIVTIGIRPSRPETGYGYVEAGDSVRGEIVRVRSFKEKPNLDVAEQYLAAGNYLWNAGIFVWNVRTITRCITTYKPSIATIMERMKSDADVQAFFPQCEKISIDYAVMEPAAADGRVYTHPADFGWSDLGNWASLHEKLSHDEDGNGAVGPVHLYECHDCVVHAEDANKVVLQGLDGFIVSAKGGRLLVCRRSEEQRIKEFSQQ